MLATGKPVVVVNMTGSAVNLRTAEDHAAAILQVWYPGGRGGKNVAAVLFGETSPSGKLPVTFYEHDKDLPEFTDYSMKNRTYRYYEGTPLYPFGYGLTYGDCRAEAVTAVAIKRAEGASVKAGETAFGSSDDYGAPCGIDGVQVRVKVCNSGKAATQDVLQIYVKNEEDDCDVTYPHLSALQRVELAAGEEKEVTLTIAPHELSSVDEEGQRKIRTRRFTVYAGFAQPDARSRELTGRESASCSVEIG